MKVLNLQFKQIYLFLKETSYMFRLKYVAGYEKKGEKFIVLFLFSHQLGHSHIH